MDELAPWENGDDTLRRFIEARRAGEEKQSLRLAGCKGAIREHEDLLVSWFSTARAGRIFIIIDPETDLVGRSIVEEVLPWDKNFPWSEEYYRNANLRFRRISCRLHFLMDRLDVFPSVKEAIFNTFKAPSLPPPFVIVFAFGSILICGHDSFIRVLNNS